MIKKILICSMAFLGVGLFYGQSVVPDTRLEVKYSKAELETLKQNNQEGLAYLNYCIENAFVIMPFPEEKAAASELRGVVQLNSLENINFFDLGLEIEDDNWQYYRIEGERKLLVIYSKEEILRKMKK